VTPLEPRPFNVRPVPGVVVPGMEVDPARVQRAQELMRQGAELLLKDPEDPKGLKLMQEGRDLLLKGMVGNGRIAPFGGFPQVGRVPDRFRLGVRLERVSELAADQLGLEVGRGVGISGVMEGSPAEKAGFKTHDIVLEFAGKPVSDDPEEFTRLVNRVNPGQKVDAVVIRKGKKVELKGIELVNLPRDGEDQERFGNDRQPVPERLNPKFRRVDEEVQPPAVKGRAQGQGGNSVSYSAVNGEITIKAVQDGVQYAISGKRNGEENELTKVIITDGDKKVEAESLDKVPEPYKAVVERLMKFGKRR
jgi:hypothetical protein